MTAAAADKASKEFSNIDIAEEEEEEEEDDEEEEEEEDLPGWQIAYKAIKLALNNRVEDAESLLNTTKATCVQSQAGYCYLTFIVSTNLSSLNFDGGHENNQFTLVQKFHLVKSNFKATNSLLHLFLWILGLFWSHEIRHEGLRKICALFWN